MPGIYVNDSSLGPGIAQALSGIANNFSPKTQAEAELMRQQTEEANWKNRQLSTDVPAHEQAVGAIPGMLSDLGANPGHPGLSQGGPGADYTGTSNSPSARGMVDTSKATPFSKWMAGEVAAGRGSPEAMRGAVELGQQATKGPGNTFQVQSEVSKQRQLPVTLSPGQNRFQNPEAASGKGGVLSGGSEYDSTAAKGSAEADMKKYGTMAEEGSQAAQHARTIDMINQVYDAVVNNSDASGQISAVVQDQIRKSTGLTFTNKADGLALLDKLITQSIGALRSQTGIQRVAGPEITIMQRMVANGTMKPEVFHAIMNAAKADAAQRGQLGEVARKYQDEPTSGNARAARKAEADVLAQDPYESVRRGSPELFGQGKPSPEGPGTGGPLRKATSVELRQARELIAKGENPAGVAEHMRANGVDPGGL
jgi:hypothetical protein